MEITYVNQKGFTLVGIDIEIPNIDRYLRGDEIKRNH